MHLKRRDQARRSGSASDGEIEQSVEKALDGPLLAAATWRMRP
jgi:hypothetical protein